MQKKDIEMTTFVYEISRYKRRDDTHQVVIRMTHNRKVVRKPSTIYAKKDQLSRDGQKLKDALLIDSVGKYIDKLRNILSTIDDSEFMEATDLWNKIQAQLTDERGFRLDFIAYTEKQMQTMEAKTAEGYRSSIRAFKKYLGSETIDINEINYSLLVKFKAWLESQHGKGCRAASYYLSCLRHIHRLAREEYNDDDVSLIRIPRQPFKSGLIPSQPITEHRALTLKQVQSIYKVEPKTSRGKLAKDVFLLSFALVGINTIDLYFLKKGDLKDGKLSYNRHKTDSIRKDKAFIVIKVEEEAMNIINRYKGRKMLLSFADRYTDHKSFNRNVNKGMKEIGDILNIEGLNTGYARHSWATIARNDCSIPRETVDEALNHAERGGSRVTDIYIKRDFSRIWEANRKVLDLVNLPASDQSQEAAIEQKPLDGTEQ